MSLPGIGKILVSNEEFSALPIGIQKKCFSSLERLHIAFQTAHPRYPFAFNLQAEYSWFTFLPEKVQRQLFSLQEREILASFSTSTNQKSPPPPPPGRTRLKRKRKYSHPRPPHAPPLNMMDQIPNPIRHRSFASSITQSPPSHLHSHSRSYSQSYSHHRQKSHVGTIDSSIDDQEAAVYYQDPQARHKLRQYLASPQKFDEALTFGFPSVESEKEEKKQFPDDRHFMSTIAPTTNTPISANNDAKRFLSNDSSYISFLDQIEDDVQEDDSSFTTLSDHIDPLTPEDRPPNQWKSSRYNRMSMFKALDTHIMPSLDLNFQPSFNTALANREMTLRMTLTRPDLRTNNEDEVCYGWRRNTIFEDPLALEALPPITEDHTGMHGVFALLEQQQQQQQQQQQTLHTESRPRRSSVFQRILKSIRR